MIVIIQKLLKIKRYSKTGSNNPSTIYLHLLLKFCKSDEPDDEENNIHNIQGN